ncbi:pyruvate ferredoxin oxidoreductase [bacterium]|nr:pyruvate ferredoxin oxidoreductase [bacterium]
MIEIRLHGRGGQGVVTASELVAISAFKDGKFSQAFPSFGVERTGAPIEAFTRIDNKFIRTREQIYTPNILVVLDASLFNDKTIGKGVNKKTQILVNTALNKEELIKNSPEMAKKIAKKNLFTVDATGIALKILGKNFANTVILGALAKNIKVISLKGLEEAIKEKFSEKSKDLINKNLLAIKKSYE